MKNTKYYTVLETAEALNLSTMTVYRDIKKKIITPERIGNQYLINTTDKKKLEKLHK